MRLSAHFTAVMRMFVPVAIAASCCAAQPAPQPTPRVLIIGIDGLRAPALEAAHTPNLDALIADGCYTDQARTGIVTVSGPGWSSFLCGVWMDRHGVKDNSFEGARYDEYPHFFARLREAKPDVVTAHVADWMPIDELILGTSPGASADGDFRFSHAYEDDGDVYMTTATVEAMAEHDPDVTFVYFADVDVAGHAHGFHRAVDLYLAEIEEVDGQVGEILSAMRARPQFADEDWLVIVSTDHGGTIDGSHGRNEDKHRKIPFIVSGRAAHKGWLYTTANQVDIPAIAMAHLGVAVDPKWRLDGRVVGLQSSTAFGENLIFNGDAEYSGGYDDAKTNAGVPGWTDTGAMTVVRYGGSEGFPAVDSPGPSADGVDARGVNFFCGGQGKGGSITQVIDVADVAEQIGTGVQFDLSGWFGGFADQRDLAWLTVRFLDNAGGELGSATIGEVTAQDRAFAFGEEDATGFIRRTLMGDLPRQTRRLEVTLYAETGSGACDGYADNLSLVLRRPR
jgi:Type I phosphodiesterase / nucleotide pyrophosphatase